MSNRKIAISLIAAGYLAAAIFYSGYGPNFVQYLCLVCPNIDSMNYNPVLRFVRQSLVFGSLNELFLLAVAWTVIFWFRAAKRFIVAKRAFDRG